MRIERAEGEEHFRVTWLPHEPYADGRLSGRTHTPGDADLPDGFPVSSDPAKSDDVGDRPVELTRAGSPLRVVQPPSSARGFQAVQVRRGSPARRPDQPARSGSTATTLSSNTASAEKSSVTPVAVHAGIRRLADELAMDVNYRLLLHL